MAVIALLLALLLAMASCSSASYCVCNDGQTDKVLQLNIDYACGAGADCSAIRSGGACYQPNTVKAHCDYAVNYYYQKENQVSSSCDFKGTASVTNTLPSTVATGCTYPASPSQVTASTPTSTITGTPSPTTGGTGTGTSSSLAPTSSLYNAGVSNVQLIYLGPLAILLLTSSLVLWG